MGTLCHTTPKWFGGSGLGNSAQIMHCISSFMIWSNNWRDLSYLRDSFKCCGFSWFGPHHSAHIGKWCPFFVKKTGRLVKMFFSSHKTTWPVLGRCASRYVLGFGRVGLNWPFGLFFSLFFLYKKHSGRGRRQGVWCTLRLPGFPPFSFGFSPSFFRAFIFPLVLLFLGGGASEDATHHLFQRPCLTSEFTGHPTGTPKRGDSPSSPLPMPLLRPRRCPPYPHFRLPKGSGGCGHKHTG